MKFVEHLRVLHVYSSPAYVRIGVKLKCFVAGRLDILCPGLLGVKRSIEA